MLNTFLPVLSAIAIAVITAYVNFKVGNFKNNVDMKTIANNASDALRDDLLQVIDRYEKREQALIDRIDKNEKQHEDLQNTITSLRTEISDLRIENQGLKAELQRTRKELEAFERKVYYVPPKEQE